MRRDFINKVIAGTIISTTLCTLLPVRASAEWVNDYQNNWYYTQDGQKLTGWKNIDGQLYYFDGNGKMQTGWITAGNSGYFLQNNGVLKIGWFKYDRNWYYSDSNGVIQTGTLNIAGKVYIFDKNGIMKTNNTVINGQFYTIGSDGSVAGAKVPTPDKEFDAAGKCLTVLKNTDSEGPISPTYSSYNDVIKDQSISNDDPNEGRTFKVRFKDSNGAELKTKSIKNGKTVDLYEPTKDGYVFGSWNTKSDGSGKSYESSDDIKVKEDINLYAQWTGDTAVYVDGITIKGSSYVTVNKTTQMKAEITPDNATNKGVTWSVADGTGKATIDSNGVLTGTVAGTVTVKATAQDKSKYSVTKEMTVSTVDITVPVSKITVGSETGSFAITASGGTLQMTANVYPDNANNQDIKWSVDNIGGSASIDPDTGLVTAISDGVVTVSATAQDGSGKVGSTTISISGQSLKIPVTSVEISGKDSATKIDTDVALGGTNGTLQINAKVLPATASNKSITWSIVSGKEYAKISSTGLITAIADGTVVVQATVNETGLISNKLPITISGQSIKLTGITVTGDSEISGETTFSVVTSPAAAAIKEVKWSVENKTGSAEINSGTGVLTPKSNGLVVVRAIATAKDGSSVYNTHEVTINGISTNVPITSIVVSAKGNVSSITADDGTLDMIATISPSYATTTSQAVTWSVSSSGTNGGSATIDPNTGVLKAVSNGPVLVEAAIADYPTNIVYTPKTIYISGQFIQADKIDVKSYADATEVAVGGTLQMSATVTPSYATYQTVTWKVKSGTGTASIDSNGILKGSKEGTVNVIATSTDSYHTESLVKTITVIAPVKIATIEINASSNTITSTNGTVQMSINQITPDVATNKVVTWSVEQAGDVNTTMTGKASITTNTNGATLKALSNGTVRVKATAVDGSKTESNYVEITINQPIKATAFTLKGYAITNEGTGIDEVKQIANDDGMLQLMAGLTPTDATTTPASVTWTVEPYATGISGKAGNAVFTNGTTATTATTTGVTGPILKAVSDGDVKVKATGTIEGGTVITGEYIVSLSGQVLKATGITINKPSTSVTKGKLVTLTATITPTNATTKNVKWEIVSETGTGVGTATIGINDGSFVGITAGVVNVKVSVIDETGTEIITTTTPINIIE